MKQLTMLADGVEGADLGVYGEWQYALRADDQVLRRRASDEGTYGGWRWECSIEHARRNPTLYPFTQKLICAWCNAVLREGTEPASHGICDKCGADTFPQGGSK